MAPTKLDIKVNAVKRLQKEVKVYQDELVEQENSVCKMKETQEDPFLITKQEQLVKETRSMIEEVKRKSEEQKSNLSKFLDTYDGDEDTSIAVSLIG